MGGVGVRMFTNTCIRPQERQTLAYGCMRDQVVSIGTKHHKALCILTGPMSDKVVSYTKHHRASGILTGHMNERLSPTQSTTRHQVY